MPFRAPRPLQLGILFGLLMLAMVIAACGGGGASEPRLSEEVAAGVVREKLGRENPGSTVHCEILDFESQNGVWAVRCSLTNVLGKRWNDWSVDDQTLEVTQLPGGEPGFPTNRAEAGANSTKYLADNRDRLAICVQSQVPEEGVQSEAMAAMQAAIAEVSKDTAWVEFDLSSPQPTLSAGCPSPPRILLSDAPAVSEPSYYRVHVFVMTKDDLEKRFGDQQVRRAAEEKLCAGDFCWEVTTGIYLSPDELSDTRLVSNALRYGVGLR